MSVRPVNKAQLETPNLVSNLRKLYYAYDLLLYGDLEKV